MRFLRPYEELMDTNPLLRLVVPLMLGILVGDFLYEFIYGEKFLFILFPFILVVVAILIQHARMSFEKKRLYFLFCLNGGMFLLGVSAIVVNRYRLQTEWSEDVLPYRFLVTETPKELDKIWRVVGEIYGGPNDGYRVNVGLMRHDVVLSDSSAMPINKGSLKKGKGESERLIPGDILLLHTRISVPHNTGNPDDFDVVSWLRHQSISGSAFCFASEWQKSEIGGDYPFYISLLRWRDNMVEKYAAHFSGSHLGVLSAMTLGDKTKLDTATRTIFSQTGVSHVLALSGLHLSILYAIFHFLFLSCCRRRWLYVLISFVGIGCLWGFAFLAGLPLSLIRACVMYSIMLVMGCFRHDNFSINNLALAALLLLCFSPQSLFDVGFQLSFLSVFCIVLFARYFLCPAWISKYRILKILFDSFAVSCCAQLATAPLVAYYFHNIPMYGFVSNWVAIPLAYLIMSVAFLFFVLPCMQPFFAWVMDGLLSAMESALNLLSHLPGASFEIYPTIETVVGVYLLYYLFYRYSVYRKIGGLYLSAFVVLLISGNEIYQNQIKQLSPRIIIYHLSRVPVLHAIASTEESYIWTPDSLRADSVMENIKKSFWKEKRISRPHYINETNQSESVLLKGSVFLFNGCRVAICNRRLPRGKSKNPLPVDYLWISRGAKDSLSVMFDYYNPKEVVLDASLTDYYSHKYRDEAMSNKCNCYDIKEKGALTIIFDK